MSENKIPLDGIEAARSAGPKVSIELNGKPQPLSFNMPASTTSLAASMSLHGISMAASKAQAAVEELTLAGGDEATSLMLAHREISALQADISSLHTDIDENEKDLERLDAFGTMTQRVAIAALLVQCGAKPKDLTEITKVWMAMIPRKPMDETSMEELYQSADDAVTQFYKDKQQ